MATRRTNIEVVVQGLDQLRALNTTLTAHDRALNKLTASYASFNAAMTAAASGTGRLGAQFITFDQRVTNVNKSINTTTTNIQNLGNAATGAQGRFGGLLGTMLQYRAVSAVFEGITRSITSAFEAMREMEKQAARVQRVSAPGSTPTIRADFAEEAARTGADIKDIGEAYYQLKTQIKDNAVAFSALNTAMNLVVGTEADARQTTRAMLQIYAQFGSQLDHTVGEAENFRRIGELLAVTWKGADAEMVDITNSLKYLGPIAEAAGVKLEQVTATISALTAEGHRGRMGGTEAAQFISQILKNYDQTLQGIKGKDGGVWHFKLAIDPVTHGVDLFQTIKNIVDTANRLPVEQARKFLLEISGSQNSFRFLGTTGADFMRLLTKEMKSASDAMHGLTHESEDLRKTMNTTTQEFQRAWGGALTAMANMIDASPIRGFLRDIANDIERINNNTRNMEAGNARLGGILGGRGAFSGDPNATRAQSLAQRATLQEILGAAREGGVRGRVTTTERFGGMFHVGNDGGVYDAYQSKTPQERGYLQRFMQFANPTGPRAGVGIRDVTFDLDAMQVELDRLQAQLRGPMFGRNLTYGPANPFTNGLNTRRTGLDANGRLIHEPGADKGAEKAANDLQRARLDKLRDDLNNAKADLTIAKSKYPVGDARIMGASQTVDMISTMLANLEHDPATLKLNRAGVGTEAAKTSEEIQEANKQRLDDMKQKHEDAAREHAAFLEYYAENAQGKYGVFSRQAEQRAQEAQTAAEAAATGVDLQKLRDRSTGPLRNLSDAQREALNNAADRNTNALGSISDYSSTFAQEIISPLDARIRSRQLGLRPNRFGGTPDSEQQAFLTANAADIGKTLALLQKNVPEATDQIAEMKQKLAEANAALTDFKDQVENNAYQQRGKAEQDNYQLRIDDINHLHKLKFYKDDESATADTIKKYQEFAKAAEEHLASVKGLNSSVNYGKGNDQVRQAAKELEKANQDVTDAKIEATLQKYQTAYGGVKGTVRGSLMDFFHGQGDAGTVAERIGGSIVDAALESQIKQFSDPLIQTVTKQILEIQGNTEALRSVTDAINGGGGGAGGGGGSGSGGGGTKKRAGLSDLQKGVTAGLAAYSIGATSAAQGVNAGNLIGGVLAGSQIGATFGPSGGLIGAAVGGIADLIGGLFHKKSKPTATPEDLNPALYNAPSTFDLAAYRYSAFGKLPTLQNIGFDVKPQNVPIVNVYVDGAKVAAQQVINSQSSSINVSLSNMTRDRYVPI